MVQRGTSNRKYAKSKLVIKFPFQNPLFFQNEDILNWRFSDTILVTAWDLLRDDVLISKLQKSGTTLREYFYARGFSKKVKIMADTGIFAYELMKSKLMKKDLIENPGKLNVKEILYAYELIDPDYLVAPDEIILLEDTLKTIEIKIKEIEFNLRLTVDKFPKSKIYATIQGIEEQHIEYISKIIGDLGIPKAARGGLLPLRRNMPVYRRVLKITETSARRNGVSNLHAFGLPGIPALVDFFHTNHYQTVDTSTIYFYTRDKKYITKEGKLIKIRKANLMECGCKYCILMNISKSSPNSGQFMINLYNHNSVMLLFITGKLREDPLYLKRFKRKYYPKKIINKEEFEDYTILFTSASDIEAHYRRIVSSSKLHKERIASANQINTEHEKKVLIISGCSKTKFYSTSDQPGYKELRTEKGRRKAKMDFIDLLLPAKEMYRGYDHLAIVEAVRKMRDKLGTDKVDHYIVSAGFGLISDKTYIPPYDTTFSGKTSGEIIKLGKNLLLSDSIKRINTKYQLVYLALSSDYLTAIGDLTIFNKIGNEIVIFNDKVGYQLPIVNFETDEFKLLAQEGISFQPKLDFDLKIKGNLLLNFVKDMEKECPSFLAYWHKILNCSCNSKAVENPNYKLMWKS